MIIGYIYNQPEHIIPFLHDIFNVDLFTCEYGNILKIILRGYFM